MVILCNHNDNKTDFKKSTTTTQRQKRSTAPRILYPLLHVLELKKELYKEKS